MSRFRKVIRGCQLTLLAIVVVGVLAQLFSGENETPSVTMESTSQNRAAASLASVTSIPATATLIPPTSTPLPPTETGYSVTRFASSLTRYTHGGVNLREGPGTSYSLAGAVPAGSILEVIGQSGDWYLVRLNGREVYVAGWLTFDSPLPQPAQQQPASAQQPPANVGQSPPQSAGCVSGPNNQPGVKYEETCTELKKKGICGFPRGDLNYSGRRDRDGDGCACNC